MSFSSIAELKKAAELTADNRKKLHGSTCDQVYAHYNKLFKNACGMAADPEQQYILYLRCGELFSLLKQKNGFVSFKDKNALFSSFKSVLSQLETLDSILTKKFEEAAEKKKTTLPVVVERAPEAPSVLSPTVTAPPTGPKLMIQPKELVRLVEQEKKSVLILDFRPDQHSRAIKYTKDAHQLAVIPVPREIITNGLIFGNMKNLIGVGHRVSLSRISSYDYVVLMDDDSPHFRNDEPERGTLSHILKLAVFDYNTTEKPKNAPIFMNGGFNNWKLQYPMYIQREEGFGLLEPKDSLDDFISSYKRASLSLEYPDLSPKRARPPLAEIPMREEITVAPVQVPVEMEKVEPERPEQKPVSPIPAAIHPTPNENVIPMQIPFPEVPSKPPSSETPQAPAVPPRPITPPRLAGGESPTNIAPRLDNVEIQALRITQPSVDRRNKPEDVVNKKVVIPPPQAPVAAPRKPIAQMPIIDRSAKPGPVMTEKQRDSLLHIYKMMSDNIWENSSRRSSPRPGQTGLNNMGNTCFMNAVLQALFQTPYIVDVFTRENFLAKVNPQNSLGTGGIISSVFSALVDNVWSGQFASFKPLKFLHVFANEVNEMLMNHQQQDASEFYMILLASLHEDTNQVWKGVPPVQNYTGGLNIRKEALDFDRKQAQFSHSPISRILNPRTVSEVTCSSCRTQSITFEDVNIVQVALPPESRGRAVLTDCLQHSFSAHNLDGAWDCPKCKMARPATQKLAVWSLPSVVVVHLLRFSYLNGGYVKNNIPVAFDTDHLDMSPYLHPATERTTDPIYKLYSVTNHRGQLSSGHYTAFSRHLRTNEWMRCDDETVSPSRASEIDYSAAYILYFKRRGL